MTITTQKYHLYRTIVLVFLCIIGYSKVWGEEVSFDASQQNYENYQQITGFEITDGIYAEFTDGTDITRYYNTGTAIRCYAGGNLVISSTIGNITNIKFTFGEEDKSNTITPNFGTFYESIDIWEGSSPSITFSIGGSSGHRKFKTITVTYDKDGSSDVTEKTIESISISGTPLTTTFIIGSAPSPNGLEVTAFYNDNSTSDITNDVVWTFQPETITANTTQVTATASYNEHSADFTFDIVATNDYIRTIDLTTNTSVSNTPRLVKWNPIVADFYLEKGKSSTNANEHIGGNDGHTRVYKGQILTINPKAEIAKVVLSTTDEYYTKLPHTYTNASHTAQDLDIIIVPDAGGQPIEITFASASWFTKATLYYCPTSSDISDARHATLCLPYNAIVPDGVTAYTATDNGEFVLLTEKEDKTIAANEGVVLKGEPGTYTFVATEKDVQATEENAMVGVTEDTELTSENNAYLLTRNKNDNSTIAFRKLETNYTLGANKAYLKPKENNARELYTVIWNDNETGIEEARESEETEDKVIYNLSGQRLKHVQKGINIINGKLIIK